MRAAMRPELETQAERQFCYALLSESTDVIARVTARYLRLREGVDEMPEWFDQRRSACAS